MSMYRAYSFHDDWLIISSSIMNLQILFQSALSQDLRKHVEGIDYTSPATKINGRL